MLARQVTHKHVVRIHDLGELQGHQDLTMPFVEEEDLADAEVDRADKPFIRIGLPGFPSILAHQAFDAQGLSAAALAVDVSGFRRD